MDVSYPNCLKCQQGVLVPLSDYGRDGAAIHFKAWVCTNLGCGFNVKIGNGDVFVDEPLGSGVSHAPRTR